MMLKQIGTQVMGWRIKGVKDVTGFELGRAIQILKDEGAGEITVKLAKAPRNSGEDYDLLSRVVRQKEIVNSGLELVVCNLLQD